MSQPTFEPHPVKWTAEKVERFWDYYSGHQSAGFFSETYGRSLVAIVVGLKPSRYLDIGCGTGEFVIRAARRGILSVGVDSSAALIAHAIQGARDLEPPAEFRQAPATRIPFEDSSFDVASLVEVVEHLNDETLAATLAEARRVIRPGGHLLVTTPYNEDLCSEMVQCPDCGGEFHRIQHVRSWTPRSLRDTLASAGFNARVRGTRLTEEGPLFERVARTIFYRLTRAKRHLVAVAQVRH